MAGVRTRRSAGRPSQRVLTQENITAAALEVITSRGYEGFTMSSLAARLQVAPSALYNHASSKAEVLRWIQDHLMAEVDTACFAELDWPDAVRTWARSYREVFARHTPLIAVIAVLQVSGAPRTLAMYEAVTEGSCARAGTRRGSFRRSWPWSPLSLARPSTPLPRQTSSIPGPWPRKARSSLRPLPQRPGGKAARLPSRLLKPGWMP